MHALPVTAALTQSVVAADCLDALGNTRTILAGVAWVTEALAVHTLAVARTVVRTLQNSGAINATVSWVAVAFSILTSPVATAVGRARNNLRASRARIARGTETFSVLAATVTRAPVGTRHFTLTVDSLKAMEAVTLAVATQAIAFSDVASPLASVHQRTRVTVKARVTEAPSILTHSVGRATVVAKQFAGAVVSRMSCVAVAFAVRTHAIAGTIIRAREGNGAVQSSKAHVTETSTLTARPMAGTPIWASQAMAAVGSTVAQRAQALSVETNAVVAAVVLAHDLGLADLSLKAWKAVAFAKTTNAMSRAVGLAAKQLFAAVRSREPRFTHTPVLQAHTPLVALSGTHSLLRAINTTKRGVTMALAIHTVSLVGALIGASKRFCAVVSREPWVAEASLVMTQAVVGTVVRAWQGDFTPRASKARGAKARPVEADAALRAIVWANDHL